ncbi:hypothetical protein ABN034_19250 [Actinopolymorpha sp. B11F2]|uniref:hypothetical protein n=1 Tax=Actinopolymorpha sp. B11F2 TaxID=3160862 RepID=UPI0032E3912C
MGGLLRSVLRGAAAGAAGTTALNAVTYLDMAARGRAASHTPEDTVEILSMKTHVPVPGQGEQRHNRVAGLAPLTGLAAGVATGALLGALRGLGWRPSPVVGAVGAMVVAMLAGNAPMAALGVTDPRGWAARDWAADLIPHLAYGAVTSQVLDGLDRPTQDHRGAARVLDLLDGRVHHHPLTRDLASQRTRVLRSVVRSLQSLRRRGR